MCARQCLALIEVGQRPALIHFSMSVSHFCILVVHSLDILADAVERRGDSSPLGEDAISILPWRNEVPHRLNSQSNDSHVAQKRNNSPRRHCGWCVGHSPCPHIRTTSRRHMGSRAEGGRAQLSLRTPEFRFIFLTNLREVHPADGPPPAQPRLTFGPERLPRHS
jgi:hypothetical protein